MKIYRASRFVLICLLLLLLYGCSIFIIEKVPIEALSKLHLNLCGKELAFVGFRRKIHLYRKADKSLENQSKQLLNDSSKLLLYSKTEEARATLVPLLSDEQKENYRKYSIEEEARTSEFVLLKKRYLGLANLDSAQWVEDIPVVGKADVSSKRSEIESFVRRYVAINGFAGLTDLSEIFGTESEETEGEGYSIKVNVRNADFYVVGDYTYNSRNHFAMTAAIQDLTILYILTLGTFPVFVPVSQEDFAVRFQIFDDRWNLVFDSQQSAKLEVIGLTWWEKLFGIYSDSISYYVNEKTGILNFRENGSEYPLFSDMNEDSDLRETEMYTTGVPEVYAYKFQQQLLEQMNSCRSTGLEMKK